MKRFVLYHFPCPDGAFACLAARLHFKQDACYVPHNVNVPLDLQLLGSDAQSEIFLLDYCGPEGLIPELCQRYARVTLIDHHKTAKEYLDKLEKEKSLPSNFEVVFDLKKSGATLALSYFNPHVSEELKKIFSYIEDNDLWLHRLPNTKEFSAGLRTYDLNFDFSKDFFLFDRLSELSLEETIRTGAEALAEEQKKIELELSRHYEVALDDDEDHWVCLAVDTEYPTLRSSLGNQLATLSLKKKEGEQDSKRQAVGAVCMEENGLWKVSLRSIGAVDTTIISKKYGGGGHLNASSFTVDKGIWAKWKRG